MTRLLVPEMFGVMAIATTVSIVLNMLSDLGLRQNVVQSRRGDDPLFLDTVWAVQIARGFVLWLLAVLLSAALHLANTLGMILGNSVYASPALPLVIAVSSLSAVIAGFQSSKMSTALRSFDQKRVVQIALVSQVAALTVMIPLGAATRSIWALVLGGLVSVLTTTVLSHAWMSGHPNRWRWEKRALRELFDFGKWVFVSSGLYVLAVNGDRLLLGAFVDAHVLGLYAIASLLIGAIAGTLNRLFFTVSLPALSEIARNAPSRLPEIYNRLSLPGDLFLGFMTGLLFAAGRVVIDFLYDARYAEAGTMLQVLALSLFAVRYGVANQVYLALGLPRYVTVLSVVRFIALYALVPALFYLGGTQAAIWGVALHSLAGVPFVYAFNAKLGLNDIRRELLALAALPAGFLCGSALKAFQV